MAWERGVATTPGKVLTELALNKVPKVGLGMKISAYLPATNNWFPLALDQVPRRENYVEVPGSIGFVKVIEVLFLQQPQAEAARLRVSRANGERIQELRDAGSAGGLTRILPEISAQSLCVRVRLKGAIEMEVELARIPERSECVRVEGQTYQIESPVLYAMETPVLFTRRWVLRTLDDGPSGDL